MNKGNLLYAQSGGVTAVINATACAVIEACRRHRIRVYAARNGIIGALREELIDLGKEDRAAIAALRHTPGGAFGSCRFKLKSLDADRARYERLIDVLRAHDIRYFPLQRRQRFGRHVAEDRPDRADRSAIRCT